MGRYFFKFVFLCIIFGMVAFSNTHKKKSVYAQISVGNYTLINDYNSIGCLPPATMPCYYQVTELGVANNVEVKAPFSSQECMMYSELGYLMPSSMRRIYVPLP